MALALVLVVGRLTPSALAGGVGPTAGPATGTALLVDHQPSPAAGPVTPSATGPSVTYGEPRLHATAAGAVGLLLVARMAVPCPAPSGAAPPTDGDSRSAPAIGPRSSRAPPGCSPH